MKHSVSRVSCPGGVTNRTSPPSPPFCGSCEISISHSVTRLSGGTSRLGPHARMGLESGGGERQTTQRLRQEAAEDGRALGEWFKPNDQPTRRSETLGLSLPHTPSDPKNARLNPFVTPLTWHLQQRYLSALLCLALPLPCLAWQLSRFPLFLRLQTTHARGISELPAPDRRKCDRDDDPPPRISPRRGRELSAGKVVGREGGSYVGRQAGHGKARQGT